MLVTNPVCGADNGMLRSLLYNRSVVTKPELETRLHDAIRAGDELAKRTLRMVLAAWKLAEVDRGGPLDEGGALSLLQKEAKGRRETIADAERAGRQDLIQAAQAELAFLESFLPQPLTERELEDLVLQAIREVGASSPDQMGLVMKALIPTVQGRADGKALSQAVRNLLKTS